MKAEERQKRASGKGCQNLMICWSMEESIWKKGIQCKVYTLPAHESNRRWQWWSGGDGGVRRVPAEVLGVGIRVAAETSAVVRNAGLLELYLYSCPAVGTAAINNNH